MIEDQKKAVVGVQRVSPTIAVAVSPVEEEEEHEKVHLQP